MKEIWRFSPSSLPLLQQCMDLAAQDNSNNKWQQLFGQTPSDQESSTKMETELIVPDIICIEDTPNTEHLQELLNTEVEGNILEIIENNLLENIEFVIKELDRKPQSFRVLTEKSTISVIEKLSTAVTSIEHLPESFLKLFIEYIVPKLLKESSQHYCIEILSKIFRNCADNLQNNLLSLLSSMRDCNATIFHDFSQRLEPREKRQLIITLSNLNLNNEDFSFIVPSLIVLFRDCEHKKTVLSNILSLLYKFREELASNKDFGRLVLNFLQNVHTILSETDSNVSFIDLNINLSHLEIVVENNKTQFRKPCLTLLQKIQTFLE